MSASSFLTLSALTPMCWNCIALRVADARSGLDIIGQQVARYWPSVMPAELRSRLAARAARGDK